MSFVVLNYEYDTSLSRTGSMSGSRLPGKEPDWAVRNPNQSVGLADILPLSWCFSSKPEGYIEHRFNPSTFKMFSIRSIALELFQQNVQLGIKGHQHWPPATRDVKQAGLQVLSAGRHGLGLLQKPDSLQKYSLTSHTITLIPCAGQSKPQKEQLRLCCFCFQQQRSRQSVRLPRWQIPTFLTRSFCVMARLRFLCCALTKYCSSGLSHPHRALKPS